MKSTPIAPAQAQFLVRLIVAALLAGPASSAKILFYFGMTGHSHVSSAWPIIEALGHRGHQITLLTSIVPRSSHPNVTVVHVPEVFEAFSGVWDEGGDLIADRLHGNQLQMRDFSAIELTACSSMLSAPSAQVVIHNSSFDLVIIDTGNDCAIGLAALKYHAPFIICNALTAPIRPTHDEYGMPTETSWVPDLSNGWPVHDFVGRLRTTVESLRHLWHRRVNHFPRLSEIFVEKFNLTESERPDFVKLSNQLSLMLVNTHYAHGYALNLPPLIVSIAGVAIQEKRTPLPEELEEFVEAGPDGFVYISFGTAVVISKCSPELRAKFFRAIAALPGVQFVWKWEGDVPVDAPRNIFFGAWMPQQDLLAHPKVRGYITHGGINGINEGVHFGVPMIIFPIFGDQNYNAQMLEDNGLGLKIEITDFTEKELRDNLKLILDDESLKARVKRASDVFKDRPMKPLDTAVWWVEFVLRHKDTSFLMPGGVTQTWYQRRLLDVWFLVYTVTLAGLTVVFFIAWKLLSLVLSLITRQVVDSSKLKKN